MSFARQCAKPAKHFSQTTQLVQEMHKGKGTFGRVINDPALYQKLIDSFDKFNKIADSIQNGNGTMSKLINDPSLYNSAADTLKKADLMMARNRTRRRDTRPSFQKMKNSTKAAKRPSPHFASLV